MDIENIIEIYQLFTKYCNNVGASINNKKNAYRIDSISDFNIHEKELTFVEIVGYNPYASLRLASDRARIYVSDTSDKNLILLKRDVDILLADKESNWNYFTSDGFALIFMILSMGSLFIGAISQNMLIFALGAITVLGFMFWTSYRNHLRNNKHIIIKIIRPRKEPGKISLRPYATVSINWSEIVNEIGTGVIKNIINFIVYGVIGTFFLWLLSQVLHIKIF